MNVLRHVLGIGFVLGMMSLAFSGCASAKKNPATTIIKEIRKCGNPELEKTFLHGYSVGHTAAMIEQNKGNECQTVVDSLAHCQEQAAINDIIYSGNMTAADNEIKTCKGEAAVCKTPTKTSCKTCTVDAKAYNVLRDNYRLCRKYISKHLKQIERLKKKLLACQKSARDCESEKEVIENLK